MMLSPSKRRALLVLGIASVFAIIAILLWPPWEYRGGIEFRPLWDAPSSNLHAGVLALELVAFILLVMLASCSVIWFPSARFQSLWDRLWRIIQSRIMLVPWRVFRRPAVLVSLGVLLIGACAALVTSHLVQSRKRAESIRASAEAKHFISLAEGEIRPPGNNEPHDPMTK